MAETLRCVAEMPRQARHDTKTLKICHPELAEEPALSLSKGSHDPLAGIKLGNVQFGQHAKVSTLHLLNRNRQTEHLQQPFVILVQSFLGSLGISLIEWHAPWTLFMQSRSYLSAIPG